MSFVYLRLIEELQDRWRVETQAALVGWHIAGAMGSEGETIPRPDLPEWPTIKRAFDDWLVSGPDGLDADDADGAVDPAAMDLMIAYGWKE